MELYITNQSFVPGRGPKIKDIFIDSAGATVGIGFYWLVRKVVNK